MISLRVFKLQAKIHPSDLPEANATGKKKKNPQKNPILLISPRIYKNIIPLISTRVFKLQAKYNSSGLPEAGN